MTIRINQVSFDANDVSEELLRTVLGSSAHVHKRTDAGDPGPAYVENLAPRPLALSAAATNGKEAK